MAGIVFAPYAKPSKNFRHSDVRKRVYRGRCVNNSHVAGSLEHFTAKRDDINALINAQDLMHPRMQRTALKYVEKSYKNLDSQKNIEKELIKKCLG